MLTTIAKGVAFSSVLMAGWGGVPTPVSAASMTPPGQATYLPMQAMTYDLGSKAAIGYFVREGGACHVVMMIGENGSVETASNLSAARLRLVLLPGQRALVDSEEGRSIDLTCGQEAGTLIVRHGPTAEVAVLTN
jgi:hypothetical protein